MRVKKPCPTPGSRSDSAVNAWGMLTRTSCLRLEAGRGPEPAVGDGHRFEQRAHLALTLADQARPRPLELLGAVGTRALRQRLGPQVYADRAEEIALVDRAVDGGAGSAGAARHGGEIDVGGEIAIARGGERIDIAVGAQRLQRVAITGYGVAVIDQERRSALFDEPSAEFEHQPMPGWAHLEHFAVRRGAP